MGKVERRRDEKVLPDKVSHWPITNSGKRFKEFTSCTRARD